MSAFLRRLTVPTVMVAGVLSIVSAAAPKASSAEPDFKALHAKVDAACRCYQQRQACVVWEESAGTGTGRRLPPIDRRTRGRSRRTAIDEQFLALHMRGIV